MVCTYNIESDNGSHAYHTFSSLHFCKDLHRVVYKYNVENCKVNGSHAHFLKILHRPKEMNAVSTKVLLGLFPPVCPFAPSIFSQVTPRRVLHS